MLIRFTVTNFLSFREPATLSMVKSLERRLTDHVCLDEVNGYKLLRGAIIYGANAAGKSNLIHCMQAAKDFVERGIEISQQRAFKLSPNSEDAPSSFDFEFVSFGKTFAYGFDVHYGKVVKEWLYEIQYRKEDKLVFERSLSAEGHKLVLGQAVSKALKTKSARKSLRDLMSSVPDDKLAVFDFKSRNVDQLIGDEAEEIFATVYAWFVKNLEVVKVGARAEPQDLERYLEFNDEEFRSKLEEVLRLADPGIARIAFQKYDGELAAIFPPFGPTSGILDFLNTLEEGMRAFIPMERRRFLAARKGDELLVWRLIVVRENELGEERCFELNEESDGTRRIIDLASRFLKDGKDRVLIIDEMDRSLHPVITRMFHDRHYSTKSNSQLIIATHEHYLLSQDFYRRDEIWFVDKDRLGSSSLYSLAEYETSVRFDKDIRKDYLLGRYGAIPKVGVL